MRTDVINLINESLLASAADVGVILRRWYELLLKHSEELAQLMTLELGKPISESRGEVIYGARY